MGHSREGRLLQRVTEVEKRGWGKKIEDQGARFEEKLGTGLNELRLRVENEYLRLRRKGDGVMDS